MVTPKKHLGQHFLKEDEIAQNIANALIEENPQNILEIGAGTGVLTKYLVNSSCKCFKAVEVDRESIDYLTQKQILTPEHIIPNDVLKLNFQNIFDGHGFSVIGNFPYNISSQILFKVLEGKDQVNGLVGMFQKEVADRITSKHGSKTYGILSVLIQAYFEAESLFDVSPDCFNPPPKVMSSVIKLKRKATNYQFEEALFFRLVKAAFGQRRKMLRNSLKSLTFDEKFLENTIFAKRPEHLSVREFICLTEAFSSYGRI